MDDAILDTYRSCPGSLGTAIRSKICVEDGYTFFRMEQGRCPFLNDKNLCRLILEGGEHLLSTTCREHPRFWEEYGDRQETCLAISCPEAARLLLEEPFRLTVTQTPEHCPPDPELDTALLDELLELREELFALAMEDLPMEKRLDNILALFAPCRLPSRSDYLTTMTQMEFTDHRLQTYLARTLNQLPEEAALWTNMAAYPMESENLLLYFLYRYVLRGLWDGFVYEKVAFSLCSLLAIFTIATAQPGDFRENLLWSAILYSREVEHSPDNLSLLYECAGT